MPKNKDKPFAVPSIGMMMAEVSNDERVQLESVGRAINEKLMVGKLATNWCPPCGRWRLQFVSSERMKAVLPNETFLCTKCGTPIKLILDHSHVLISS